MSRLGLLLTLTLLAPHAGAEPLRLLALPVVGEDVDPGPTAEVQAGLDAGLAAVPGLERVPSAGPTFCVTTDTTCIAAAGRTAKAAQVVHTSLRSTGTALSVSLVLVPSDGRVPRRLTELVPAGAVIPSVVRAAVVRLVAPERWVGALQVEGRGPAELWIDGERSDAEGERVDGLVPGQHLLRVVRPGRPELRGEVEVRFGATTRVRLDERAGLVVVGVEDGAGPASAPSERPAEEPVAPAVAPAAVEAAPAGLGPGWRVARWTLLGVGVALVAGGVVPALAAEEARDEERGLRNADGSLPAEALERQRELASAAADDDVLSAVLISAGGACLAGSAAIFLYDALAAEPAAGTTVSVAPVAGDGLAFTLTLRR